MTSAWVPGCHSALQATTGPADRSPNPPLPRPCLRSGESRHSLALARFVRSLPAGVSLPKKGPLIAGPKTLQRRRLISPAISILGRCGGRAVGQGREALRSPAHRAVVGSAIGESRRGGEAAAMLLPGAACSESPVLGQALSRWAYSEAPDGFMHSSLAVKRGAPKSISTIATLADLADRSTGLFLGCIGFALGVGQAPSAASLRVPAVSRGSARRPLMHPCPGCRTRRSAAPGRAAGWQTPRAATGWCR